MVLEHMFISLNNLIFLDEENFCHENKYLTSALHIVVESSMSVCCQKLTWKNILLWPNTFLCYFSCINVTKLVSQEKYIYEYF